MMKEWLATESGHIAICFAIFVIGAVMVSFKVTGGNEVLLAGMNGIFLSIRGTGNGKKEPTP